MILVGLSVGEDIASMLVDQTVNNIPEAHAATSTGGVTLSTSVQAAITLTLATGTVPLGNLTPGTPIFATTSASVDTNNATGLTFQVNRNSATSTLLHTDAATTFPDQTAWNGSNATTTNILGANLHFKVAATGTDAGLYSSGFWGNNDTDGAGNARYAGFPTAATTIASNATYVGSTQTIVSRYRINAPATQKTGTYSGGITYTAFTNP